MGNPNSPPGSGEANRIKTAAREGAPYFLISAGVGITGPYSLEEVRPYLKDPWSYEGTVVLKVVTHPGNELRNGGRKPEGDLVPTLTDDIALKEGLIPF